MIIKPSQRLVSVSHPVIPQSIAFKSKEADLKLIRIVSYEDWSISVIKNGIKLKIEIKTLNKGTFYYATDIYSILI